MEETPEQELIDSQIRSPHNRETASEDSILIENSPPYFDYLRHFIEIPAEQIVRESRRYEKPYLAWQSIRHAPGKTSLTGFEGYFVGVPATNVQEKLIDIGSHSLQSLTHDPMLKQEVFNTLTENKVTLKALQWLNTELGSITARLRAQTLRYPLSSEFKSSMYEKLGLNSGISYTVEPNRTLQSYRVPSVRIPAEVSGPPADSQPNALQFMSLIGKAGHPLVRAALHHIAPV